MSLQIGAEPIEALLAELETTSDNGGLSVNEIAARTGRSVSWVRGRLRTLQIEGRLVPGHRRATAIDGKASHTPVYRVKAS
jgi:DNA-binding IclR family transcriptional regulator